MTFTLFEVAWEVCNKVGGIHAVVSGKARLATERFGDDYVLVGPWLQGEVADQPFDDDPDPQLAPFVAACRELGVEVRIGRSRIPGAPRTVLVSFASLFPLRDAIFEELWREHGVDSLYGDWDYVEPAMFGYAAALAVRAWCERFVTPRDRRAIAHFHEWTSATGVLHLATHAPEIGTLFTPHATALGRALAATGATPEDALGDRDPRAAADALGVRAKHSLEGVAARAADVLSTVSAVTAAEVQRFSGREPDLLTPNGVALQELTALAGGADRAAVRERLGLVATQLHGRDLSDAVHLGLAARYEFVGKGVDLALEALRRLADRPGPQLVLWVLAPGAHTGVRRMLRLRLASPVTLPAESLGTATHELLDPDADPVRAWWNQFVAERGADGRVAVVHVPAYLDGADGALDLPYEAVLGAMDASVLPSLYEPWGHTPAESLALGVPTVTSDRAGFDLWALEQGLTDADGVVVLERAGRSNDAAADALVRAIEQLLERAATNGGLRDAALRGAQRLAWERMFGAYERAHERVLAIAAERVPAAERRAPAPPGRVHPVAQESRPRYVGFEVSTSLPEPLRDLEALARNYWWSWDPEGAELFRAISERMWEEVGQNPVAFLRRVYPADVAARAADEEYLERLGQVAARFREYLELDGRPLELGDGVELSRRHPVAYFCLEFGIHPSLRIYSGGLGVLAGDHLKSASDLALPLVGVGLYYRRGYVRQELGPNGEQISLDVDNDPRSLPLEEVAGTDGRPLRVVVHLTGVAVSLRVWRVDVGRVPLYLLDADVDGNRPEDRALTARLYGGGTEDRIRQEILLGKGGVRLLGALDIEPRVVHMNEGHAAFAALERASNLVHRQGLTFEEAREVVRATTAFTTHTPVPAGHDVFPEDLMRRYFPDCERWIGLPWERFMALGSQDGERFNMTHLSLSMSGWVNGVARRHGEVSRDLLHPFWSGLAVDEVPVSHVTNGVHLPTWVRPGIACALGVEGRGVRPEDFAAAAGDFHGAALWAERRSAKRELLESVARRLTASFTRRQDSPRLLARMLDGLTEEALVVGFARRFAPYKRATLLFQDAERLARLVGDAERPVVFLFAGKAHPADAAGQDLVRQVAALSRRDDLVGRVVFVEDYDMELARLLVQGVDVWLNNPIRPLEASGTSGMKAAANGALNLSVLDGWWIEGCEDGRNGWAIGGGRVYPDQALQDQLDNEHLLSLLEETVVPLFFDRDGDGLPRGWLERVRRDLETVPVFFNTDRMVAEYRDRAYAPLALEGVRLAGSDFGVARALAADHRRVARAFEAVRIREARIDDLDRLHTGDRLHAELVVELGELEPDDVLAELVVGHAAAPGDGRAPGEERVQAAKLVELAVVERPEPGVAVFRGGRKLGASGRWAYGLRVRPRPRGALDLALRGLVYWA